MTLPARSTQTRQTTRVATGTTSKIPHDTQAMTQRGQTPCCGGSVGLSTANRISCVILRRRGPDQRLLLTPCPLAQSPLDFNGCSGRLARQRSRHGLLTQADFRSSALLHHAACSGLRGERLPHQLLQPHHAEYPPNASGLGSRHHPRHLVCVLLAWTSRV